MIVGITGNSGVGKSFLIKNIKRTKYVIDADRIGHECLLMAECKTEIVAEFGDRILNSSEIDRKKLGKIVFLDKAKLEILTTITHKYILNEINYLIEINKSNYELIIIDAPLLVEAGLHKKCDKSILVTASFDEKIKRIVERDKISKEVAEGRLNKQSKDETQQKNVDIVFENGYNLKSIENFNMIINKIME